MTDIDYVNSAGVRLDILATPYLLQTGDLFDYEWDYESVDSSPTSARITSFTRSVKEKELTLSILNYSRESYYAAIDRFFETVEYDVINQSPGKLYVGDQYLKCYIFTSQKADWEYDIELIDNTVKLVTEYAFWIREQSFPFAPSSKSEEESEYLEFPFDVPFDLMGDEVGTGNIVLDHYTPCNFLLTVFGPCTNPRITIGNNLIEVKTSLDTGDYLQVDSRVGTVIRVRSNGVRVDEFDNRTKNPESIFNPINQGYNLVSWDGSFGFDVTAYLERSEPAWSV